MSVLSRTITITLALAFSCLFPFAGVAAERRAPAVTPEAVLGGWSVPYRLSGSQLWVHRSPEGGLEVEFTTRDCTGGWSFHRTASLENDRLILDQPVRERTGREFRTVLLRRRGTALELEPLDETLLELPATPTRYRRATVDGHGWLPAAPLGTFIPREAAPAEPIPITHWIYRMLDEDEETGLYTGFPQGAFSGKQPRTRAEFTSATLQLLRDVNLCQQTGAPWPAHRQPNHQLRMLCREFQPELEQRGVTRETLRAALALFDRLWIDPAPVSQPATLALPRPAPRLRAAAH